jgi:NAD(P)-dependent dehydrogenase (short-subunit alcohol dehydrogenase family)
MSVGQLEGQVAIVTGAGTGIGRSTALLLAKEGAAVVVAARTVADLESVAKEIEAEGGKALAIPTDVSIEEQAEALIKQTVDAFGRLDILVNNAGVLLERGQKPSQTPVEALVRTYATNVYGVVAVTNAMLPLLRRSAAGRIVNVSSGLGSLALTSDPTNRYSTAPLLAYNSSKSALNAVTVSYANELRGTPIKVNAADPGYCATDLNGHSGPRTPAQGAAAAIRLATLPADGPTAGFFSEDGTEAW